MADSFFITTAIDYTNGAPHIGHAYEKVLADVLARYHRLKGDDVFFLTGVDQHGQKVQQSAEKQGVEPQQFVDGITAKFVALWKKLEVEYTAWAATTDPLHKECVRANLQRLWDDHDPATGESRWLYKKTERGWYSVRQEQFLTDKERGPDGEFGPEWGQVEEREEENFYFRLKGHKQWLLDFIDRRSAEGRPFVVPEFRVAELRNAVEKLEVDLCVSRPASRLRWGIPFPESFGTGFVTFVWFDALVNYISFVPGHDPNYSQRTQQPADGKAPGALSFQDLVATTATSSARDIMILRPRRLIASPLRSKALGFADEEMPTLLVHGWWNISGAKMSKSLGNVVDPDLLADKYGAEAVRYYLVSDIATGKDSDFSEERLIQRFNTDLANSIGNLLNRSLNMAAKYRGGVLSKVVLPIMGDAPEQKIAEFVNLYRRGFDGAEESVSERVKIAFAPFQVSAALEAVFDAKLGLASRCNLLIENEAPWKLAKDPTQAERLDASSSTRSPSPSASLPSSSHPSCRGPHTESSINSTGRPN